MSGTASVSPKDGDTEDAVRDDAIENDSRLSTSQKRTSALSDPADTPLMRQYLEIKEAHPDCIVFFRLGDFYEMFYDDAVVVARTLDLTLTSRDKSKENAVPMCGVPHHSSRHYLAKLVAHGFKVAIAE